MNILHVIHEYFALALKISIHRLGVQSGRDNLIVVLDVGRSALPNFDVSNYKECPA
jgi:hypothetical protein